MRTFATLAFVLALPCGLAASQPQPSEIAAAVLQPGAANASEYDTSVYHLKHARAHSIVPAVKRALVKSLAESTSPPPAGTNVSVVFIPTSSDDTLVAMCRREHAARVKQAIEACDVEKQYTVKVEVFEMGSDGETTRISGPSLFVGREGKLVVSSANGTLTLNVKLNESPAAPCDHAGKCLSHPIKTDEAQTQASDDDDDSDGPACCSAKSEASCTCPACLAATGTSCGNDCPADPRSNSASKVTHESSCRNKCSTGSSASGSHSGNTTAANSSALVGDECEVLLGEPGAAPANGAPSNQQAAATPSASTTTTGTEDSRESAIIRITDKEKAADRSAGSNVVDKRRKTLSFWVPSLDVNGPSICVTGAVPAAADSQFPIFGYQHANNDGFHLGGTWNFEWSGPVEYLGRPRAIAFRLSGGPGWQQGARPADTDESTVPATTSNSECLGPQAEPPALLTVSSPKDGLPLVGALLCPPWQAEMLKSFSGRRLSEIFDVHNGQDPGAKALGRLLAEIPKPGCETDGDGHHHSGVIVFDFPDRIRIFEDVSPSSSHAHSGAAVSGCSSGECATGACAAGACPTGACPTGTCPNCREEFRAFLEEMFRGSDLEEIAQAGHQAGDAAPARSDLPHALPSVTHSKIETTLVTYPLRDLVLVDEDGHPVFETCGIIDHIQAAVAPESWSHPSVSIQFDQQSMSLVVRQTPEVQAKIGAHLGNLKRLHIKQLCDQVERLTGETGSTGPDAGVQRFLRMTK